MSLFDVLADQERRPDQGWSYSNSFNRSASRTVNSSSVEEWPSPPSQHQIVSSVPSLGSGDSFVHEVKSSDTDDDLMLVDEPGVALGREEIVDSQSDCSVMASPGYQGSYGHNSYNYNPHSRTQDEKESFIQSFYMEQQYHQTRGLHPAQHGNQVSQQRHMQLPLHVHEDYVHSHPTHSQPHNTLQSLGQQQCAQNQQHHPAHLSQLHHPQGQSMVQHAAHGQLQSFGPSLGSQFQDQQHHLGQQHQSQGQSPSQQQNQPFGLNQQALGQQQGQMLGQHPPYNRQQGMGQLPPQNQQQVVNQQPLTQVMGQQQSYGRQPSFQPHGQQQPVVTNRPNVPDQHLPQQPEQHGTPQSKHQGMLMQILNGPIVGSSMPVHNQAYPQDPMNAGDAKYVVHHGQRVSNDQRSLQHQQHTFTQQQQQQTSPLQTKPKFSPNSGRDYYFQPMRDDINGRFKPKTESEQYFLQNSPSSSQNSPKIPSHSANQVSFQSANSSSQSSSPLVSLQNSPMLVQNSPPVLQNSRQLQNSRLLLLNSPQTSIQTSPPISMQNSPQLLLNSPQMSLQNSPQVSSQNSPQLMQMQGMPQGLHNTSQGVSDSFQGLMNNSTASSHGISQQPCQMSQPEMDQKGDNHFNMPKDIHDALNVSSSSNMQYNDRKGIQGLQENTYYSVQHNGGMNTVLYSGSEFFLTGSQEQDQTMDTSAKGRSMPKTDHGHQGSSGRSCDMADSRRYMASKHNTIEVAAETSESCTSELTTEEVEQKEASATPQQETVSPKQGNDLSYSGSPPSLLIHPRLSATNDIWPTPMPSMKKSRSESPPALMRLESPSALMGSESPPALIVDSFSSCSQQSSDSPDISSPPGLSQDENNYSPPELPVAPAPPTSVQPTLEQRTPEQRREEQRRKHNLLDDEEGTALCKYCGYSSSDFEKCEGCSRKLPPDVKVIKKRKTEQPAPAPVPPETNSEQERTVGGGKVSDFPSNTNPSSTCATTTTTTTTSLTMDKKVFYGNKMPMQTAHFMSMEDMPAGNEFVIKPNSRSFPRRRGNKTPRGTGRGRKSREPKEPVTLTISSDEDESPGPSGEACRRLSVSAASISSAQDDDDGFFSTPVTKPTSFGTSRRQKMADASGLPVAKSAIPVHVTVNDGVYFNVRGVRIGSMRTTGVEVRFMTRSIQFKVISDRTQEDFDFFVYVTEITQIKYSLNQSQPMAFLKVTPGCGGRLRSTLGMAENSSEYFDPGSQDTKKNMIVIIIDLLTNDKGMRQTLLDYSRVQLTFTDFLHEISYDEANDLLVKSTPGVLTSMGERPIRTFQQYSTTPSPHPGPAPSTSIQSLGLSGDHGDTAGAVDSGHDEDALHMAGDAGDDSPPGVVNNPEDRASRSPSPRIGFVGPVEKLLMYPSVQMKGAITITNEDLYCLNEGEFLNDVIIDFYLKYIFLERLSDEARERTQIFSSFFFKRLTQRDSKSQQEPSEVKLTPAQKRHARVKRWTRHVDIFSKDFLFIPINEHSHWYLAVICYPGLESQEHISFLPSSPNLSPTGEDMGQSVDSESQASERPTDDGSKDSSTDSLPGAASKGNHVLGKVITPEFAKTYKAQFNLGVKQACILIMDSLMGPSRNSVIRILKEYLQVEWDLKKGTPRNMIKTVRGGCPKVPQQTNYSDCGVFVLQFTEAFFDNPIASFSIPMKLERWFPLSKVERKREEIRDLILRLQAEANEGGNR